MFGDLSQGVVVLEAIDDAMCVQPKRRLHYDDTPETHGSLHTTVRNIVDCLELGLGNPPVASLLIRLVPGA